MFTQKVKPRLSILPDFQSDELGLKPHPVEFGNARLELPDFQSDELGLKQTLVVRPRVRHVRFPISSQTN